MAQEKKRLALKVLEFMFLMTMHTEPYQFFPSFSWTELLDREELYTRGATLQYEGRTHEVPPFPFPSDFGALLRFMRELVPPVTRRKNQKFISHGDLGEKAGLDPAIISGLERGKRKATPALLEKIADAFELKEQTRAQFIRLGLDAASKRRRARNNERLPEKFLQLTWSSWDQGSESLEDPNIKECHYGAALQSRLRECGASQRDFSWARQGFEMQDGSWALVAMEILTGENLRAAAEQLPEVSSNNSNRGWGQRSMTPDRL